MNKRRKTVKMPRGYSIFETAGPWEDFATPARDMRLLIAIDTVLDLPAALKRNPARFGVSSDELESALSSLSASLQMMPSFSHGLRSRCVHERADELGQSAKRVALPLLVTPLLSPVHGPQGQTPIT